MQPPPPYPQPPYSAPPPPPPPGRPRGNLPLVLGLAAGATLLLVLAAVIVVLLTSRHSSGSSADAKPFQLRRVLSTTQTPCPAGRSDQLNSTKGDICYSLGDGMTVTGVNAVRLVPPNASQGMTSYSVQLTLRPSDATRLSSLTASVAGQPQPRNELAFIVDGKVVSAPAVLDRITGGSLMFSGNFTRAQAQHYVDLFRG